MESGKNGHTEEGVKGYNTIGHSTLAFTAFAEILQSYGIRLVVDIRRFPRSRKKPQFNEVSSSKELTLPCEKKPPTVSGVNIRRKTLVQSHRRALPLAA